MSGSPTFSQQDRNDVGDGRRAPFETARSLNNQFFLDFQGASHLEAHTNHKTDTFFALP